MSTEASVAEPKAGPGDSVASKHESASPETTATVAGAPAAEPEKKGTGTLKDYSSRVLKSLTPEQYRHYRITGDLPDGVTVEEPRESGEITNDKIIAAMTPAERKEWLGSRDDKILEKVSERLSKPKEEAAAKAAKSDAGISAGDADFKAFAETTTSPLARLHSLFTTKDGKLVLIDATKEADADKLASESASGAKERLDADHANFSAEDRAKVYGAFAKELAPKLPDAFLNYMRTNVQPYLHSPYKFFREFTLNAAFRKEVLTPLYGEKGGGLDAMMKVIARFDAKNAPAAAKRKPLPPAPADSVGGKGTAPTDEIAASVNQGDFRTYMRAANRADYLRRTGR